MFLLNSLVVVTVLGLAVAKPQNVQQYTGAPGNTKEPVFQFPDLDKEYNEELIKLNITPGPQAHLALIKKFAVRQFTTKPPAKRTVVHLKIRRLDNSDEGKQLPQDPNLLLKPEKVPTVSRIIRDQESSTEKSYRVPRILKYRTTTTEPNPTTIAEYDVIEEEENPYAKQKAINDEFKKQAESAKYQFASDINDGISGNQHHREETRDGVNVKGSYSYSDGFFKHTVHYIADDKGYRVISQQSVPLSSDGPEYNPQGEAKVETNINGETLKYKVSEDDYAQHQTTPSIDEYNVRK